MIFCFCKLSLLKGFINFVICGAPLLFFSCNNKSSQSSIDNSDSVHNCMNVPSRFGNNEDSISVTFNGDTSLKGMMLIRGGDFEMGGDNEQASADEYPKHRVHVSSFYIDITEVTNTEFKKFVDATGYITTAEKKPDWDELKKSVPPGTPKPPDSILVAASIKAYKQQ